MADRGVDPRAAIFAAQFVALTTYRRDGRAVTTPVWAAERSGRLYVFTNPTAGKVKRLRNSSRASVAPCTWSGRTVGATLPATARILDAAELPNMWRALMKKYGLLALPFRLSDLIRARLGRATSAGIEVSLAP